MMKESVKKFTLFFLKLAFAVAILYWLISRADIRWHDVWSIPWYWPALAMGCLFLQIALTGVRWFLLLRCSGVRIPFPEVFSLTMQGVFFTLFIPAGSVGGDLIKAGILAKRSAQGEKFNGVFTILMDRFCGLMALVFITLLSCLVWLRLVLTFPSELRIMVWTIMLACVGVMAAAIALFFHDILFRFAIFRRLIGLLDKYSKGAFSRVSEAMTFYRAHWRLLLLLIGVTAFVLFPLLAAAVWFLAYGISGGSLSSRLCFLASNLSQTVAALPLTNGGMGTRELVCTAVLKTGSCGEAEATLTPIMYMVVFLLVSLSGSVFFIFDSLIAARRGKSTCKK